MVKKIITPNLKKIWRLSCFVVCLLHLAACQTLHQNSEMQTNPDATQGNLPTYIPTSTLVTEPVPHTIYASTRLYDELGKAQLWQLNRLTANVIYERVRIPVTDVLVPESIEQHIRNYLGRLQNPAVTIDNAWLDVSLSNLHLSPDKSKIAFTESYQWVAPIPMGYDGIASFVRVIILDLENNSVISKIPIAHNVAFHWMPDSRRLIYYGLENEEYRYWSIDVANGQAELITGNDKYAPFLSPDQRVGVQMVYLGLGESKIKIFPAESPDNFQMVDSVWTNYSRYAWKPNSHTLLFAGKEKSTETFQLFSIDADSLDVSNLPLQVPFTIPLPSLNNLIWSSDGEMFAFKTFDDGEPGEANEHLLVFDQQGRLVSDYVGVWKWDSPRIWKWSDDSDLILVSLRDALKDEIGLFDPKMSEINIIDLPPEMREMLLQTTRLTWLTW